VPAWSGRRALRILFITAAFIIIVAAAVLFYYSETSDIAPEFPGYGSMPGGRKTPAPRTEKALPFNPGEKLIYGVYYKMIRVGRSILTFHGEEAIKEKSFYHITFETRLHGFSDFEDIYAHKETFLPYRVFRLVKKIGAFSTQIQEEYDQEAFTVRIRKRQGLFPSDFTIKREAPIYNAILLPYYYRANPSVINEKFKVTLPTSEFDVALKKKETLRTPLGRYDTYVLTGTPSRFTFWLAKDGKMTPLKIESHTRLDYTFIIRDVEEP